MKCDSIKCNNFFLTNKYLIVFSIKLLNVHRSFKENRHCNDGQCFSLKDTGTNGKEMILLN